MMHHRLARALLAATALHGVCLSLAFVVALRASTVAGAVVCTVDLAVEEPALPEPAPTVARERPRDWVPSSPSADYACSAEPLVRDPPAADMPSRAVVAPMIELAVAPAAVPAIEPAGCSPPAPVDILVASGHRPTPSAAGESTNTADSVASDAGAVGGLVAIGAIRPAYPASARLRGEEGVVVVAVETDDAGRPRNVVVTTPSGSSSLDRAAVDAARRARFASATGIPSRGRAALSFRFRLVD
jgi:protein TonB